MFELNEQEPTDWNVHREPGGELGEELNPHELGVVQVCGKREVGRRGAQRHKPVLPACRRGNHVPCQVRQRRSNAPERKERVRAFAAKRTIVRRVTCAVTACVLNRSGSSADMHERARFRDSAFQPVCARASAENSIARSARYA